MKSTLQNKKISVLVSELIIMHKKPRGSVTDACKIIAKQLGCNPKTVYIISRGGYAGKDLQKRIKQVYNNGEIKIRTRIANVIDWPDTPEGIANRDKVKGIPMAERRRRLLE